MREDGFLVKEGWSDKYKKSIDCDNPKGFSQKAHCQGKKKQMNEGKDKKLTKIVKQLRKSVKSHKKQADYIEKVNEESNPRIPRKKGQPAKSKKHSDLYTDEDPKGTIHGLGFKDVATAKASVAKIRKSSRSHAHKIQAAIAMEQRARVMGKTSEAAIFRKYINSMKKKTKAMNEEKKGDHEYEMIRRQTDNIMVAAKKIKKKVGDGEGDVKAWVQSKITKAADYLDTAADYMTDKEEVKEGSLHKWFKGSKSKDGKGGWVNVVTGGTCASDEPGEGTPKCVSSAKRASMSKKERLSAARRKKKADPNQQSKTGAAKPTYVSTDKPKKKKKKTMKDETEFTSLPLMLEVPKNDAEFRLGLMFRESLGKDRGMLFIFEDTDHHSFHMKNTFIPLDIAFINEEGRIESIKELNPHSVIPVYPDGKIRYAIEVNRGWFTENGVVVGDAILEEGCEQCGESCDDCECECHNTITEVKDRKGKGSGKKDACYHKVKSRYSVWPSAYASGALVKCRKVGAANWGNSRKEEVEYEAKVYKTPHHRWRDEIVEHHKKDADGNTVPHEDEEIKENKSDWRQELDEKCWKGYEKKGMKTMFGKRYPNCVKKTKKEELEVETPSLEEKNNSAKEVVNTAMSPFTKKIGTKVKFPNYTPGALKRFYATSTGAGSEVVDHVEKKGEVIDEKVMTKKDIKKRDEIADAISTKDMKDRYGDKNVKYAIATKIVMDKKKKKKKKKMNENIADEALLVQDWNKDDIKFTEIETVDVIKPKPIKEEHSDWRDDLGEDWQKVNRKDKTDGLSKKAVKAYRRENPGSKLKTAVTKDPKKLKKGSKDAKRRLSFCRRMKGMKKRLTSAKTARDPDSRINKALRRWNC